jgi:hypothetical protein
MLTVKLTAAVLIALPIGALAQDQTRLAEGETSSNCLNNITFSHEFLAQYPSAGAACREVKMENGQKWARFDAEVTRVRGNRVTANFVDRNGRKLSTITFDPARDARIVVEGGQQRRFDSLHPGEKLSFWAPEGRAGFYAAPGASESEKLAVVSREPAQR